MAGLRSSAILRIRLGRMEKIKTERAREGWGRRKEVDNLQARDCQGGGLWGIEIQALVPKRKRSFIPASLGSLTCHIPEKVNLR